MLIPETDAFAEVCMSQKVTVYTMGTSSFNFLGCIVVLTTKYHFWLSKLVLLQKMILLEDLLVTQTMKIFYTIKKCHFACKMYRTSQLKNACECIVATVA